MQITNAVAPSEGLHPPDRAQAHQALITPQAHGEKWLPPSTSARRLRMLKLLKRPQLFIQRGVIKSMLPPMLSTGTSMRPNPAHPKAAAKAIEHHNGIQASRRLQRGRLSSVS